MKIRREQENTKQRKRERPALEERSYRQRKHDRWRARRNEDSSRPWVLAITKLNGEEIGWRDNISPLTKVICPVPHRHKSCPLDPLKDRVSIPPLYTSLNLFHLGVPLRGTHQPWLLISMSQ